MESMIGLSGQESSTLCFIARAAKSKEARRMAKRLTGHARAIAAAILEPKQDHDVSHAAAAASFRRWAKA